MLFMLIAIGLVLFISGGEYCRDSWFRLCCRGCLAGLFYDGNNGRAFHFVGDGSLWFRGDLLCFAIEDVETYAVTHAD